jgi:hypothetical protein
MMEDKLPSLCESLGLLLVHQTRTHQTPATIRILKREAPFTDFEAEEDFILKVTRALASSNVPIILRTSWLLIPRGTETHPGFVAYLSGVERYAVKCNITYLGDKEYTLAYLAPRSISLGNDLVIHDAEVWMQRNNLDPKDQWTLAYSVQPDYNLRYTLPLVRDFVFNVTAKLAVQADAFQYLLTLRNA